MSNKVLCVDDDVNLLAGIQRNLRKQFEIDTAVGAIAALKMIEHECPYAVIVADMQMPGMNGIELLNVTRRKYPDTVRVMLTGNADQKTAVEAVNRGHIYQFLNKPCPTNKLAEVLDAGIKHYRQITAERELLENTLNGSVNVLLEILSLSDPDTFGRSQMIRDQARLVAKELGLTPGWELDLAAMLAQIGQVSVPSTIRQKIQIKESLSGPEKDILDRVPQVSSSLLGKIPRLQSVAKIVLYSGKNFDGTGFPFDEVKGEEIPLESRLIKVLTDLALHEANRVARFKALDAMKQLTGIYDAKVLTAVGNVLELTTADKPKVQRAVQFSELRPGQMLISEIRTATDNVMVVGAGTRLTPVIIERLRNFAALSGIKEPIHIED